MAEMMALGGWRVPAMARAARASSPSNTASASGAPSGFAAASTIKNRCPNAKSPGRFRPRASGKRPGPKDAGLNGLVVGWNPAPNLCNSAP